MEVNAVYPGTFDPITNGHTDLIQRAAKMFDTLTVAIATNPRKAPMFQHDLRITLAQDALRDCRNVIVKGFNGLLVDFVHSLNASVILRGLRAVSDFEYEFQLAGMNRRLAPDIETVFLTPAEQYTYISSSMIKEVASLGGDVSGCVPSGVLSVLLKELNLGRSAE